MLITGCHRSNEFEMDHILMNICWAVASPARVTIIKIKLNEIPVRWAGSRWVPAHTLGVLIITASL